MEFVKCPDDLWAEYWAHGVIKTVAGSSEEELVHNIGRKFQLIEGPNQRELPGGVIQHYAYVYKRPWWARVRLPFRIKGLLHYHCL